MDKSLRLENTFGPAKNVCVYADGQTDVGPIKSPNYQLTIDLTEPETAKHLQEGKPGLSFFSSAFDEGRRSWHLKVDILKETGEISLYIVERGEPVSQVSSLEILRRSLPIKFSSVLLEMQIDDPGLKHRKTVIFYSFSHDQN